MRFPLHVVVLILAAILPLSAARGERPNVLFIAVDDLRPQLGAYGHEMMVTPHLDRLAEQGRLFERHYVQVPTCGASRYSLMTGQLPRRGPSRDNGAFALFQQGHAPRSLPQWFREHGYKTVQMGKISHSPDGFDGERHEIPDAWDRLVTPAGKWETAWRAFFGYDSGKSRTRGQSPPLEFADVDDSGYPDGLIADAAVEQLRQLKQGDQPFFLAVGFYKPHLPFNAPKKYWDLYDRDQIDISDVDPVRRTGGEFFGNYGHNADRAADPDYVRKLRHGYYASTSYVDAQLGKVLEAVDELQLRDNTIIVVWGDHGYHLGELGYWGKHTLHEHSLRAAFLMRSPGMKHPGRPAAAITSSVEIYPTLVELAGLPLPDHLDGRSFAALLDDPAADSPGDALGFWGNNHTIRTDRYRLILSDPPQLYDHRSDPGERSNIADEHPEIVRDLRQRLETRLEQRKAR